MTVVRFGAMFASWFLKDTNLRGLWKLCHDRTYGIQGRIPGVTDRLYVHYVLLPGLRLDTKNYYEKLTFPVQCV